MTAEKRFSREYATFEDWSVNSTAGLEYLTRIRKKYTRNPDITLAEARGHARTAERRIKKQAVLPVSRLPVEDRTPEQSLALEQSRGVYNDMRRKGLSLNDAAKKREIHPDQVLENLAAFKKVDGEWVPKAYYISPTSIHVVADGTDQFLVIPDSRHRELIGRHHNAIKMALTKGERYLDDFRGRRVKDSSGKWWELETDLETLYAINEAREDPEFYSIYEE